MPGMKPEDMHASIAQAYVYAVIVVLDTGSAAPSGAGNGVGPSSGAYTLRYGTAAPKRGLARRMVRRGINSLRTYVAILDRVPL
jgi:hypothetical protein